MRPYTDAFPQRDQQDLEQRFDHILQDKKQNGIIKSTRIVEELLRYWKADNPGFVVLYAHLVNSYLYDLYAPREGVTGSSLLLYIMEQAYPELVSKGG